MVANIGGLRVLDAHHLENDKETVCSSDTPPPPPFHFHIMKNNLWGLVFSPFPL